MSINAPEVITVAPTVTASIRGVVAVDALATFFDTSFSTIARVIEEQGGTVTGPAFALYHVHPSSTTDIEVGFTTDRAIEPASGVTAGLLPGGRVVRAVHTGSYNDLSTAWEQLATWMSEHHHGSACRSGRSTSPSRHRPPTPQACAPNSTTPSQTDRAARPHRQPPTSPDVR